MKEAFEKIKERLEEKKSNAMHNFTLFTDTGHERLASVCEVTANAYTDALSIVSEVEAEYGNGWIPCEKELPKEEGWYLVYTKPDKGHKSINKANFRKGSERDNFAPYWQGAGGIWRNVVAWQQLPGDYKPEKGAQDGKRMR